MLMSKPCEDFFNWLLWAGSVQQLCDWLSWMDRRWMIVTLLGSSACFCGVAATFLWAFDFDAADANIILRLQKKTSRIWPFHKKTFYLFISVAFAELKSIFPVSVVFAFRPLVVLGQCCTASWWNMNGWHFFYSLFFAVVIAVIVIVAAVILVAAMVGAVIVIVA